MTLPSSGLPQGPIPQLLPQQLPSDLPPPATEPQLRALLDDLRASGLGPVVAPARLQAYGADTWVYSPVLQPLLRGRFPQVVVRATTTAAVMAVAGACSRHRVSLTLRGAGTGNYGQAVPLAGGLVLDLTGLDALQQVEPDLGRFRAEPGILLADLEARLQHHRLAPRLLPSTVRTATLGGFVAGGSGGIGSLRWGFLRDPGHLLALELVTVEDQPRLLQLDGSSAEAINHAYGTNGIITALTMATAPWVAWQQLVLEFDGWDQALAAAQRLPTTALELQELCLLEGPLVDLLPWPGDCPVGRGVPRLLLLAAPATLALLDQLVPSWGGRLLWSAPQGASRGWPLRELCWNHTTLHARQRDGTWTYLQLLLPQPEGPMLEALRRRWGSQLLWHLEGVRSQGQQRLAALPLVRWQGPGALEALIDDCRALGAVLFNPHALTVEDGGLGVVDGDQVAAKRAHDPAGLLNPGKLRGWSPARP